MNPFKIENAKQRFFNSKEEYLTFKQAWKQFHNLQPLVEVKEIDISPYNRLKTQDRTIAKVKVSVLGPEHYMLYNLLRGHDITRGFNALTRPGRLSACMSYARKARPWYACEEAAGCIAGFADLADEKKAYKGEWLEKRVQHMLKPFGDTVSRETLATIGQLLAAHLRRMSDSEVVMPITPQEVLTITRTEDKVEVKKGFLARMLGL